MREASLLASIRSRLTYANVTATLALFVALGGSAYATASLVGGDGVIHACAAANGSLTLIKPGKRCPKGKSAVVWNQKGVSGSAGSQGASGAKGEQGLRGERGPAGAVSINTTVGLEGVQLLLTTVGGVSIWYTCESTKVLLLIGSPSSGVSVSGNRASNGVLESVQQQNTAYFGAQGSSTANMDVIATVNGTWSRLDLGASRGVTGCNIWGLVTPGG